MNRKRSSKLFQFGILSALFLGLFSCSKELDFDMIDDVVFESSAKVPLASLTLSLADLTSDVEDSTLVVDPDNALRIYYRQDSVFTYEIDDILTIPDQDPIGLPVEKTQPNFDLNVALGTIAGAQLYDATFSNGTIAITIDGPNAPSSDARFVFTLRNATINGQTYADTFRLEAGNTTAVDSSIINNMIFDFTNGGTSANALDIGVELVDTSAVQAGDVYNFNFALKDLEIEVATGYFGDRVQAAPPGDFEFNINGFDQFAGGFYLTNPTLTLYTRSTVGLPLQIETEFIGENAELNRVALDAAPFEITASPSPGVEAVSNITLDPNNSQITEFLANIPNKIYYSGAVQVNPNGQTATPNFISNTSNVVLDFEVDVPLEFRLEDMRLDEVVEDLGAEIQSFENLDEMTLFFRSENRLPFDLILDVSFINAQGDSINGFELPLLNAASVDANGRVSGPSIQENPVVFDEDLIADFLLMKDLRFVARVNTTNGGQTSVKLYDDYDLKIQTAIQARGNYQISND